MFHITYVGILPSVNVKVRAGASPEVDYPITLTPEYPQGVPQDTANAVQIQAGPGWTVWMPPVYTPTQIPGTQLTINWSPDNQVIVLMDDNIGD